MRVVHLVLVVTGKNKDVIDIPCSDPGHVLPHCISRAAVPLFPRPEPWRYAVYEISQPCGGNALSVLDVTV
jgi:hypothetical protein